MQTHRAQKSVLAKATRVLAAVAGLGLLGSSTVGVQAKFTDQAKMSTTITSSWGTMGLRYNMAAPGCDYTKPIALGTGGTFKGQIEWGDGTHQPISQYPTHTYSSAGTFDVRVTGSFTSFNSQDVANNNCLVSIPTWEKTGTTDLKVAFWNARNLTFVATPPAGTTSLYSAFNNAVSFNQNIDHWDTSQVTNMGNVFYGATKFNQPLNSWDVSKVTQMNGMFTQTSFNQPLDKWKTSKVTRFDGMFWNNAAFNQPIGGWDTSSATTMGSMFTYATAFNQPIGTWNTAKVVDMTNMFYAAASFDQPLAGWNTANVTSIGGLFWGSPFNRNIDNWDVRKVTNAQGVFQRNPKFNQPLNSWRLVSATNLHGMFEQAVSFNQPLNNWQLPAAQGMDYMFSGATAFSQNLSMWALPAGITRLAFIDNSTGMYSGGMPSSWWPVFP